MNDEGQELKYTKEKTSQTIYEFFSKSVTLYPDKPALMYKRGKKSFEHIRYAELDELIQKVAASLKSMGIKKGDTVGIFSHNRPEWTVTDLAVLKLGGIVVPIYPTLPPFYVKYIISDSKIKIVFVENAVHLTVIDTIRNETAHLEEIVLFNDSGVSPEGKSIKFDEMIKTETGRADGDDSISSDDAATIVYTSGTTGEPKGVVLTHANIVSNVFSIMKRCKVTHKDITVSYLPLSHMFERTCGYYGMLFAGATIAYAEHISTLVHDVATVRPTILIAVPRVIEKAYDEAVKKVEGSSFFKKALVSSAIRNLNTFTNMKNKGLKVPIWLGVKYRFYDTLVASKFRNIAGGRLRVIASGGAPLDQKLAKILYILGFNILEGYGLTETSPIVSCHTLDERKFGTVGKLLDGINVAISENDEILVKGPNVMRGYLNKPEETAKVIDNNGWLHTGDQGRFDDDGNLIITGRIKELIVTSYGKKIASAPIEAMITKSRYIAQSVLYGDKRKYIVALIVPDREPVESYARGKKILYNSYPGLLEMNEIRELIRNEIDEVTVDLATYEKVKAFALIPEEFTVEDGLLTPTLKLRKKRIAERYRNEIHALYDQSEGG